MAEVLLEAERLIKRFGAGHAAVTAVDDVSLRLHAGEVVMVMGPSGSGKTTLLTILGLLLRPDSGRVLIQGQDATAMRPDRLPRLRREHLGFVFQDFLLLPSLTASENVEVAAQIGGHPPDRARKSAERLLAELGLANRMHDVPKNLSGGERQRVALARALVNEPLVLLADEPTANLDSTSGKKVAETLRELARARGCGVLMVSHDERICPYTDTMYLLEDGRIRDVVDMRAEAGSGPPSTGGMIDTRSGEETGRSRTPEGRPRPPTTG